LLELLAARFPQFDQHIHDLLKKLELRARAADLQAVIAKAR
jgi:hypothetical protein